MSDSDDFSPVKKKRKSSWTMNNNIWDENDIREMQSLGVDVLDDGRNESLTERIVLSPSNVYNNEYQKEGAVARPVPASEFLYTAPHQPQTSLVDSPRLNPFEFLSNEVLLHLFQFLPHSDLSRLAQVCKRFRLIAMDSSLWPRLNKSKWRFDKNQIAFILLRGVKTLNVNSAVFPDSIISPKMLTRLTVYSPPLQYLDLSCAHISPSDLTLLLKPLRHLLKLSIEAVAVTDEVCLNISENEQLETLNLALVTGLSRKGVSAIVRNCQNLESINLSWTKLSEGSIEEVVTHISPKLTAINLAGAGQFTLRERDVIQLINRCPNLVELDLSDCLRVGGLSMSTIALNLPKLQALSVNRCIRIPVNSLRVLHRLENLWYLTALRVVTTETLSEIQPVLPRVSINDKHQLVSRIARPTVGTRRTSIWLQPTN